MLMIGYGVGVVVSVDVDCDVGGDVSGGDMA